ncbi:hypothetical protein [Actinomadura atramentaria]|uniref:hypothetical protein n=1 Tax=Actinomadura atramentaria TaxID=1990 RepID=UPI0003737E0A|nr:hypothetical protein [Actinomadura atramentaria]
MDTAAERWRAVRARLGTDRAALGEAADRLYPGLPRVPGTALLTRPEWLPDVPVPLEAVRLEWAESPPPPLVADPPDGLPPGFRTYADALAALAPPRVLENRPAHRLLAARLDTDPVLRFGPGRYFDALNVGELAAHELAAHEQAAHELAAREQRADERSARGRAACRASARRTGADDPNAGGTAARASAGGPGAGGTAAHSSGGASDARVFRGAGSLPLRGRVGDPRDLGRRAALLAITTVALTPSGVYPLHWRDPAKVAHAGGLHQVVPVGMFQSPTPRETIAREFAEELFGAPEGTAATGWDVPVFVVGLGVDPLTFATDLLTVALVPEDFLDGLVAENAEGTVTRAALDAPTPAPMQPAGTAALALARRHRHSLSPGRGPSAR